LQETLAVGTNELLQALNSRACLLAASADDKDIQLVLQALEKLLTLASCAAPAGADNLEAFKAKSNRW
jgi:hypothetical protein